MAKVVSAVIVLSVVMYWFSRSSRPSWSSLAVYFSLLYMLVSKPEIISNELSMHFPYQNLVNSVSTSQLTSISEG